MNAVSTRLPDGRYRTIGVDPGLADVGWGVIDADGDGSDAQLVAYGTIRTPAGTPLAQRLQTIHDALSGVIVQYRPTAAVIEQLYFARNVKTAMVVAHGRAACILATAPHDVEVFEYTPLQIKKALTGHGRASKIQVQQMVRAVLGLEDIPKPDHAADALAAALCHAHSLGLDRKIAATGAANPNADTDVDPRKLLLAQRRRRRR